MYYKIMMLRGRGERFNSCVRVVGYGLVWVEGIQYCGKDLGAENTEVGLYIWEILVSFGKSFVSVATELLATVLCVACGFDVFALKKIDD